MKKTLPFVKMWMDLGDIMLSEISQTEKYDFTYMWNLKKQNKLTNRKRNGNRLTDTENKLVVSRGGGCW